MSRRLVSLALIAGALALAGCATTTPDDPVPAATSTPNAFAADGLQDPRTPTTEQVAEDAVPTRVQIPRIGVDSTLEDLTLGAGGELTAPVDFDLAGWYSDGVVPGEIGPAIIAGHVDSVTAPAVFARIAELADGDEITVTLSTGESVVFVVSGSMQSAKASFPTDDVYRNVPRPELRLITCAGAFDRSIGHYTDNLIVFASLRA